MCGIAGIIDLAGQRDISPRELAAMARAISHRGPDEEGFLIRPGLGLASRRLSIVGLADGQQPVFSEDGGIAVVYNGELFDHPEQRQRLEALGHRFRTGCDTEVLVHLWKQHGRGMLDHLRGQFAFALVDFKQRVLILARDQLGICPLYWARRDGKLYFGSEIKALLDRADEPHCFRLHKDRVFYASERVMRQAGSVAREELVSMGVCFGRFTKSRKFRLKITALAHLAQHAKFRVWLKPSAEMSFLYGNHVSKNGVARMTEGIPQYGGVLVLSMSDLPLGFGRAAQTTERCKELDATAVAVLHQSDVGEYLREESEIV